MVHAVTQLLSILSCDATNLHSITSPLYAHGPIASICSLHIDALQWSLQYWSGHIRRFKAKLHPRPACFLLGRKGILFSYFSLFFVLFVSFFYSFDYFVLFGDNIFLFYLFFYYVYISGSFSLSYFFPCIFIFLYLLFNLLYLIIYLFSLFNLSWYLAAKYKRKNVLKIEPSNEYGTHTERTLSTGRCRGEVR